MRTVPIAVMFAPLTVALSCSNNFQPYGWEDSCNCVLSDGGTAVKTLNLLVCDKRFEKPGERTNYVCHSAAELADAGCTTPPSCTCQPQTPSSSDCD
jgi:hypothetical protein